MLLLPTGAGKTRLAAEIINNSLAKGNRVLFCVPRKNLVEQTAREFWAEGICDVGIIQANHPQFHPDRPVQICSLDTLKNRKIPEAGLVIIDEAHVKRAFVVDWMGRDEWADVPFIGLSATPWAKGLGRLYDKLIIGATTADLINAGFLSPFRVFAPSHPDLSGVRTGSNGDFRDDDLEAVMNPLVGDVVTTWLQRGEDRPTLCFAVDCAHARLLQEQFVAAGVACGYVDADTPDVEREAVRMRFASGELRVVCNVDVLTTGVDWDVRCIILARPTKSEMRYVQAVGRGLRIADGKDCCLVLDHSDTTLKLGFVTDIHHTKLDGGSLENASEAPAEEVKPRLPRECKKCSRLLTKGQFECPSCGHKPERSSSGVEWVEGDLVELSAVRKANAEDWAPKVAFARQLKAHALEKGKGPKWFDSMYRARFGVWPNDPRVRYAEPAASVGADVRSWIISRGIAYSKSKQKRAADGAAR